MMLNDRSLRALGLTVGLGALLAASPLAVAQAPMGWRGPVAFPTLDRNGDGRVSADEFAAHRAERLAARAAEGRPLRNAAQAPSFALWDRDGNGYLTPNEVASGQQGRMATRGPGPGRGRGCWRNP
jgi:hypothetical protein